MAWFVVLDVNGVTERSPLIDRLRFLAARRFDRERAVCPKAIPRKKKTHSGWRRNLGN